jgi:hypothetical protein
VPEDEEEEMEVPATKRHKSFRKCNTFVARSREDILIKNEDVMVNMSDLSIGKCDARFGQPRGPK